MHNSIYRQRHTWLIKKNKRKEKKRKESEIYIGKIFFFFSSSSFISTSGQKFLFTGKQKKRFNGSRFISQQRGSHFQYLIEPIKYPISLNKLGTSIPVGSLNFTSLE